MQKDPQDANWTNILDQEDIHMEQMSYPQSAAIRKLIMYQPMRHKPSDQDTSQETYDGQEYLACHEVEHVEQRITQHVQELSRRS
jgi:hypothetical protein